MTRRTAHTITGTALVLGLMGSIVYGGGYLIGSRRIRDHVPGVHFDGKRFRNAFDDVVVEAPFPYPNRVRRLWHHERPVWEERPVDPVVPARKVTGTRVVATHINHATVLIQTQGINILTDPIWSRRASPIPFVGPKRFQDPGVRFKDLPKIDVVLVSHNHYDHMDITTLRALQKEHAPQILVHTGNSAYLARYGIEGARDMVWGDTIAVSPTVSVTSVPAQHNTERWVTDANHTLWGGFVIKAPAGNIYFAGDTGYGPFVQGIRNRYPEGFLLGLLPIGAYAPRWYCRLIHTDPADAFQMKRDLGIAYALAMHFGTFPLGDEPQNEPVERLYALREEFGDDSFVAVANGGSLSVTATKEGRRSTLSKEL